MSLTYRRAASDDLVLAEFPAPVRRLAGREDINSVLVLRLLGWPEIVLPRGYAQAGR